MANHGLCVAWFAALSSCIVDVHGFRLPYTQPVQRQSIVITGFYAPYPSPRRTLMMSSSFPARKAVEELEEFQYVFLGIATIPPLTALALLPGLSFLTENFLQIFRMAEPVDGGRLSVELLQPIVNGVVLPTFSIALGTLFATTINVLRQRQVDIRADLNNEVCELRLLRRAIFGCFGTYQHAANRRRALKMLRQYSLRLTAESSAGGIGLLEDMQDGGGGIAENELDSLSAMLHGTAGASAARQNSIDVAHNCISTLNRHRSSRVALLTSGFPAIHYGILAFLSLGIIVIFLFESNLQALQFLNKTQLQLLFSMLVGVCSTNAALCFDLADPFRGSFSVTSAARQLTALTVTLEEDLFRAKKEVLASTVGSSSTSLERGDGQGALSGRETVLFHLFTSPLAAQARMVGDLLTIGRHATMSAGRSVPWRWRPRMASQSRALSDVKERSQDFSSSTSLDTDATVVVDIKAKY